MSRATVISKIKKVHKNHGITISNETILQLNNKDMNPTTNLREQLFNLVDEVYERAVIDMDEFKLPIVADVPQIENDLVELEIAANDL